MVIYLYSYHTFYLISHFVGDTVVSLLVAAFIHK